MIERVAKQKVVRVRLRPVEPADIELFYEHEIDPAGARMAGVKPRGRAAFLSHWERILTDEAVIERTILADDEVAGRISCFESDHKHNIGYWIGREFWGCGVATRALGLLLAAVAHRPLHADVIDGNTASIRALERHGFCAVGHADEPETDRYLAGKVLFYKLA